MKTIIKTIAAIAAVFALASCDNFNGDSQTQTQAFATGGAISIQLPDNAPISRSVSSGGALGGSISKFKVVVRNLAAKINTEQYANPGSMVTIDNLLPGSWDVAIFGYQNAAQGSDLELCYYGNARNTQVIAGLTSYANVALYKVEGNTRLDFTLASDPSGAAASRTSVSKAYVVYSCDELGQSGTAFYDYAEPQGGDNPQPADTSKIIIPVPDFLEPGYSCSAKVYLFTSDNVGGGYKTLWNGTLTGKAQAGGTLSGNLAYTETCLVNSSMGTNHTYIRMDKAFSNELHNNMGYEFAPQTSGSTGTAIDYADLEIFPAVADSCGDSVPLIVKYQDMIWTDNFEFKHLSAVPSIVVPGMVTESTGVKKLYIPDFVSRTLSTPTFSPSAPTQFKVCEAASSDDYGFAKYSVSGTETDSWSAPFQYVSTDPSGTAKNVEFTAPSTFYPKSQGATDGFTCNTVIARGTHGYFADAEAATTKSISVPFTVEGASWTATGPGDVMLYSPFTITLECAAALASELDAVLPSLTVNVGTSEITGVTKARSGSKIVLSVPGQDTWSAGEQKTLSIEYNSHQLGNDVMVNIAQPTSGGGGSGGGNGGGGGTSGNTTPPAGFVEVEGMTINCSTADYPFTSQDGYTDQNHVFVSGRNLTIKKLWVSAFEVSQKEYGKYMKYKKTFSSPDDPKYEDVPDNDIAAHGINWTSAIIYCNLRSRDEGAQPVYYIILDSNGNITKTETSSTTREYDVANWVDKFQFQGENYIMVQDGKYFTNGNEAASGNYSDLHDYLRYDDQKNGYRLPTEAEWEYCARGGKEGMNLPQGIYGGGVPTDSLSVYANNGSGVFYRDWLAGGTKSPNYLGLYDMLGNAAEWCWDKYFNDVTDSRVGPYGLDYDTFETNHVLRGNHKDESSDNVRVYFRGHDVCSAGQNNGLRVVRTIED